MNLSKYRYRLADIGRAFHYAFGRSLPHPNDAGREPLKTNWPVEGHPRLVGGRRVFEEV